MRLTELRTCSRGRRGVVGWSRTSHTGPDLGSVRAQALHDGAKDGDVLRLTFDPVSMVVRHEPVGSNGR